MGKKGKKKEKITGTPDVVKFKQTREFALLKECVSIQESLPFVAVDTLDPFSYKKVARFLNMVGLLAEFLQIDSRKEYRFDYYHKFLAPVPQFFPFGFDAEVIRNARMIQERPVDSFNSKEYAYPEELRNLAEKFLKDVDTYMTKIASEIEPRLKDDFQHGLKQFKWDLKHNLDEFDQIWTRFEFEYAKARHSILTEVFTPIDKLVEVERELTEAEERLDVEAKQTLENELVSAIEGFTHTLFPETEVEPFPDEVIPLAEACVFYEMKCTEEWLNLAKHLIKNYLEVRIFVTNIPMERIRPQFQENANFMRLLRNFHASVLEAREALAFVAKLPKLTHAKTAGWMTRKLLEPDLRHIQMGEALILDGGGPRA